MPSAEHCRRVHAAGPAVSEVVTRAKTDTPRVLVLKLDHDVEVVSRVEDQPRLARCPRCGGYPRSASRPHRPMGSERRDRLLVAAQLVLARERDVIELAKVADPEPGCGVLVSVEGDRFDENTLPLGAESFRGTSHAVGALLESFVPKLTICPHPLGRGARRR